MKPIYGSSKSCSCTSCMCNLESELSFQPNSVERTFRYKRFKHYDFLKNIRTKTRPQTSKALRHDTEKEIFYSDISSLHSNVDLRLRKQNVNQKRKVEKNAAILELVNLINKNIAFKRRKIIDTLNSSCSTNQERHRNSNKNCRRNIRQGKQDRLVNASACTKSTTSLTESQSRCKRRNKSFVTCFKTKHIRSAPCTCTSSCSCVSKRKNETTTYNFSSQYKDPTNTSHTKDESNNTMPFLSKLFYDESTTKSNETMQSNYLQKYVSEKNSRNHQKRAELYDMNVTHKQYVNNNVLKSKVKTDDGSDTFIENGHNDFANNQVYNMFSRLETRSSTFLFSATSLRANNIRDLEPKGQNITIELINVPNLLDLRVNEMSQIDKNAFEYVQDTITMIEETQDIVNNTTQFQGTNDGIKTDTCTNKVQNITGAEITCVPGKINITPEIIENKFPHKSKHSKLTLTANDKNAKEYTDLRNCKDKINRHLKRSFTKRTFNKIINTKSQSLTVAPPFGSIIRTYTTTFENNLSLYKKDIKSDNELQSTYQKTSSYKDIATTSSKSIFSQKINRNNSGLNVNELFKSQRKIIESKSYSDSSKRCEKISSVQLKRKDKKNPNKYLTNYNHNDTSLAQVNTIGHDFESATGKEKINSGSKNKKKITQFFKRHFVLLLDKDKKDDKCEVESKNKSDVEYRESKTIQADSKAMTNFQKETSIIKRSTVKETINEVKSKKNNDLKKTKKNPLNINAVIKTCLNAFQIKKYKKTLAQQLNCSELHEIKINSINGEDGAGTDRTPNYFVSNEILFPNSRLHTIDVIRNAQDDFKFSKSSLVQLNKDRKKRTGERLFSKQYYYVMNVERKRQKLDPNECEPGVCIPDECDPYECIKLINKRNKKSKKDYKTKSSSSQHEQMKTKKVMAHDKKSALAKSQPKISKVTITHEKEPANLKRPRSETTAKALKNVKTTGARNVNHNKNSQTGVSVANKASAATKLKRCFCTLKLQRSAKKKEETKRVKIGKTTTQIIVDKGKAEPTKSKINKGGNKSQGAKLKGNITLDPHECEPNVCIPDKCDPYVCLKRIQKRNKKAREQGISSSSDTRSIVTVNEDKRKARNTEKQHKLPKSGSDKSVKPKNLRQKTRERGISGSPDTRSIATTVTEEKRKTRNAEVQHKLPKSASDKRVNPNILRHQTNRVAKSTPKMSPSRRQAVRIGSSFSFSIEFYKDKPPASADIQYAASEIRKQRKLHKLSTGSTATTIQSRTKNDKIKKKKKLRMASPSSTATTIKNRNKGSNTKKKLRMVSPSNTATTIKNRNIGSNTKSNKRDIRKVSPSSTATTIKNRNKGSNTKGKKRDIDSDTHTTKTQTKAAATLKRCFCTVKLQKNTKIGSDQVIVVKNQGTRSKKALKKTTLTDKSSKIDHKLLPYECEPGICIPGSCDPKECYEKIQKRLQLKHSGTITDKRGNKIDTKNNKQIIQLKHSGTITDKRGNKIDLKNNKQIIQLKHSGTITDKRGNKIDTKNNRQIIQVKHSGTITDRRGNKTNKQTMQVKHSGTVTDRRGNKFDMKTNKQTKPRRTQSSVASIQTKGNRKHRRDRSVTPIESSKIKFKEPKSTASYVKYERPHRRQAVKIGSEFSFNIEFYKNKTPAQVHRVQYHPSYVSALTERKKRSQVLPKYQQDGDSVIKQTSSVATTKSLKRCFCSLSLKKQNQDIDRNNYIGTVYKVMPLLTPIKYTMNLQENKQINMLHAPCKLVSTEDQHRPNENKELKILDYNLCKIKSKVEKKNEISSKEIHENTRRYNRCSVKLNPVSNKFSFTNRKLSSITGLLPYLRKCFCTLRLSTSNKNPEPSSTGAHKHHPGRQRVFEPYECYPGICDPAPGQCDPYDCLRKMKQTKVQSVKVGPEPRPKHKRKSITNSTTTRAPKVHGRTQASCPAYKDGVCGEEISYLVEEPRFKPIENPFRQAVRISSSFSFNVEFYRDKMPPIIDKTAVVVKLPKCKDECVQSPEWQKSTCSQGICLQSKPAQTKGPVYLPMKTIAIGPQRCFCTKAIADLYEKSAGVNLPVLASRIEVATETRKVLPYECEPNICIPGSCDPYECLERIKKRNLRNACNLAVCDGGKRHKLSQIEKQKDSKIVPAKPLPRHKRTSYPVDHRNRQTTRIGSKFSFDVEFFKDRTTGQMAPVRSGKKKIWHNGADICEENDCARKKNIVDRGSRSVDRRSIQKGQTTTVKTESRGTGGGGLLKRCFCTKNLLKSPHVVNFVSIDVNNPVKNQNLITNKQYITRLSKSKLPLKYSRRQGRKYTHYKNAVLCNNLQYFSKVYTAGNATVEFDKKSPIFVDIKQSTKNNLKKHSTRTIDKYETNKDVKTIYPYIPKRFNVNTSRALINKNNLTGYDTFGCHSKKRVRIRDCKNLVENKKKATKCKQNNTQKRDHKKPTLTRLMSYVTNIFKTGKIFGKNHDGKQRPVKFEEAEHNHYDRMLSEYTILGNNIIMNKKKNRAPLKYSKSDRRTLKSKSDKIPNRSESVKLHCKTLVKDRKTKRYPPTQARNRVKHLPNNFIIEQFKGDTSVEAQKKIRTNLLHPYSNLKPVLLYPVKMCPCRGLINNGEASIRSPSNRFDDSVTMTKKDDKCNYKPVFEMKLNSSDMGLINRDEVLGKVLKLKSKREKELQMSAKMLKELHGKKCKCCICQSIKDKRKLAKKGALNIDPLEKEAEEEEERQQEQLQQKLTAKQKAERPCICGSKPCAKEAYKLKSLKGIKDKKHKFLDLKPCDCGAKICHQERLKHALKSKGLSKKDKQRMRDQENKKMDQLKRKTRKEKRAMQKTKAKREQENYIKRLKKNKRQAEASVERRRRADKEAEEQLKKIKHTNDFMLICDSLLDVGKLAFRTVGNILHCMCRTTLHPQHTFKRIFSIGDADDAVRGLRDAFVNTGAVGTGKRISYRLKHMAFFGWVVGGLQRTAVGNYLLHALDNDQKKRFAQMKKISKTKTKTKKRATRQPMEFECSLYMASLKKKPYWKMYYMCPWFYPHWISMVKLWRNFTEFILFICAIVVWSPCILVMEVCRATMCCTVCTG